MKKLKVFKPDGRYLIYYYKIPPRARGAKREKAKKKDVCIEMESSS